MNMKLLANRSTSIQHRGQRSLRDGCHHMQQSQQVKRSNTLFKNLRNSLSIAVSGTVVYISFKSTQALFLLRMLLSRFRIVKSFRASLLLITMPIPAFVGALSSLYGMTAYADEPSIPPSSFTLIIRMTPAACALDPELQKLRQCQDGFTLTISSLQAERPSGKRIENCSHDQTNLSPLQERVVERVMPDKQLRDEDWQRNGSCTGMSPTVYFRTIATYAQRLKIPSELASPRDTVLTKSYIINKLQQLNPGLTDKSILLRCTAESGREFPVLTELRSCYNMQGQYDVCPANIKSTCPSSVVILAAP
jgi:ribonuclease T2